AQGAESIKDKDTKKIRQEDSLELEDEKKRQWEYDNITYGNNKKAFSDTIQPGPNERLNNKEKIDQERHKLEELAQRLVEKIKEKLIWGFSNSTKIGAGYPNAPKLALQLSQRT
ncbi:45175_t:CDS:2, partial [Gigaspora margarita]